MSARGNPPPLERQEEETATLLRAAMMLQNGSEDQDWYYLTESAAIQGPYGSEVMNGWARQGVLSDDTHVRLGADGAWTRIAHIFPGSDKSKAFMMLGDTMPALRSVIDNCLAEERRAEAAHNRRRK
jgi:hypothetical protein